MITAILMFIAFVLGAAAMLAFMFYAKHLVNQDIQRQAQHRDEQARNQGSLATWKG